jgi:hypothetical protein
MPSKVLGFRAFQPVEVKHGRVEVVGVDGGVGGGSGGHFTGPADHERDAATALVEAAFAIAKRSVVRRWLSLKSFGSA